MKTLSLLSILIFSFNSFPQNLITYQKVCSKPYLGYNGSFLQVSTYITFTGCSLHDKAFKNKETGHAQFNLFSNSEGVFCSAILDEEDLSRTNLLNLVPLALVQVEMALASWRIIMPKT